MKKPIIYGVSGIFLIAVLGFGYYALSPLWRNIKIDEPAPAATMPSAVAVIVDTPAHPASGLVKIVEAGDKKYLRYEDFKTLNGPDLYVYLSKDLEAKEFINLGRLKATEGNVNYEIPAGVNVDDYRYALIWCKAFSVLFNSADIATIR